MACTGLQPRNTCLRARTALTASLYVCVCRVCIVYVCMCVWCCSVWCLCTTCVACACTRASHTLFLTPFSSSAQSCHVLVDAETAPILPTVLRNFFTTLDVLNELGSKKIVVCVQIVCVRIHEPKQLRTITLSTGSEMETPN